jgi:hypothetical protein
MMTVSTRSNATASTASGWARHRPHSIRIDANRPGIYRWMITRYAPSVASRAAADRDQAANDAAAALSELPG